jgi:hypothetical protein
VGSSESDIIKGRKSHTLSLGVCSYERRMALMEQHSMNQQQKIDMVGRFNRILSDRGEIQINGNSIEDSAAFISALIDLDDFEVVTAISDLDDVIQNITFRDIPTTLIPDGELKRPTVNFVITPSGTEYTLDLRWNRS